MSIKRDLSSLPTKPSFPPNRQRELLDLVLARWDAAQRAARVDRERAIPELPVRASEMSACDRQLYYSLIDGTPREEPTTGDLWRFMLGQHVHDVVDGTFTPDDTEWRLEETVDLRPAGIPGSSHGDVVRYIDGKPAVVVEIKSVPGFTFKAATTSFQGPPEGPRYDHCMQAAVSAIALGAPRFIVAYLSLEAISKKQAEKMKLTDVERFSAEWSFDADDWRERVDQLAARLRRLVRLAAGSLRPARTLVSPDFPSGAFIDDPVRGVWLRMSGEQVVSSGTTWLCDYCSFRGQCIEDGANAVIESATGI